MPVHICVTPAETSRRRPVNRLLAALLALAAAVGLAAAIPSAASAAGTFSNARIADLGLTHVGERGGQCWTFVQNMILAAGGRNISAAAGGNDYFAHLQNAGGTPVGTTNDLARGDVVQVGRYGSHTFIVVRRVSGNTFQVVDSNHAYNERVMTYNRTFTLDTNTRAFRFGTVGATPPPAPTPAPGPAPGPAQPVFTVMNTAEQPPDGVYFRNSPRTADAIRITGVGVYRGDRVQLRCYGWGDAVGAHANRLWYQVTNVTRPSAAGRANAGWLNAHYVDDGKVANVVDAGVPGC